MVHRHRRRAKIELGTRAKGDTARRWPVTISSETPVTRRDDFGEPFSEVLSHQPGAVDLSRSPLPVIEGHDASQVNIGIVDGLRLDGGRLRGVLELGASQRALELAADIDAKIVSGLSVGYEIIKAERSADGSTLTALLWCPHEVSIVAVPADTVAGIGRSLIMGCKGCGKNARTKRAVGEKPPEDECDCAKRDGSECDCESLDPIDDAEDWAECGCDDEERSTATGTQRAATPELTRERNRVTGILRQVRSFNLGDDLAQDLIRSGASKLSVRARIENELVRRDHQHNGSRMSHGQVEHDGGRRGIYGGEAAGDFRNAAVDALLLRAGVPLKTAHPAARDIDPSIYAIARTCLTRAGERGMAGKSDAWLVQRAFGQRAGFGGAMTTSDFPNILIDALHKSVRAGYEMEPASHKAWVRTSAVNDFKSQYRPILGSAPSLNPVVEGGEYTAGSMVEDSTSFRVSKFGRIVSITLEALVNDDLSAFLRIQPALGQAARRAEADSVYNLFALNSGAGPTMQDSIALFHASHGNLATVGALDATLLSAARTLLRRQTALGGGYMALQPGYLLAPPEYEHTLELLLAAATRMYNAPQATSTADAPAPKWLSGLTLVIEPRLSTGAIYLLADHGQIDTFEMGVLQDNYLSGPTFEVENSFDVDARRFKARHVFGVKALDWRGMVKAPVSP